MKINLLILLASTYLCSLIILTTLNLVRKEVFLLSSLQVTKIEINSETPEKQKCKVVLNWNKQVITTTKAIQQISTITDLERKFTLNLRKYPLTLNNQNEIQIQNFDNNCQWFFKPVLVKVAETTILEFLIYQIFNLQ